MPAFLLYTATILKCKNAGGIILPCVRHGSAILESWNGNSSSLSIYQGLIYTRKT